MRQEESEYYLAQDQDSKWAIFHINNPYQPISRWWRDILPDGLLQGQSNYYMVIERMGQAIFHKDNPYEPVSQWWDDIDTYGVVNNQSEYYLAQNQHGKWAIFHIEYPYEPISNWWDYIYPTGLINGISDCYAVTEKDKPAIKIYHYSDMSQPIYTLTNVYKDALLYFNDRIAVYLTQKHVMIYDNIKMQHNIIGNLSENMQEMIKLIYKNDEEGPVCCINPMTGKLISAYIDYKFIPIIITDQGEEIDYCYLYTLDNRTKTFMNINDMLAYIYQNVCQSNLYPDILRLY